MVGFVVGIDKREWDNTLRPVHSILDSDAFLTPELVTLGREISEHYACPLGRTLRFQYCRGELCPIMKVGFLSTEDRRSQFESGRLATPPSASAMRLGNVSCLDRSVLEQPGLPSMQRGGIGANCVQVPA